MAADIHSEIAEFMAANRDEAYQAFQSKLIPSIDPRTMVGVRTPALCSFAKQLAKNPQLGMFLNDLPHLTFEENQLHAFVVGGLKDYDGYVAALGRFLPFVDNWATCDQLPVRKLAERPDRTLELVQRWLADGRTYVDWQPFLGHFSQRLRPAFRNSTGLMYPSVECIRSLLYHHT